MPVSAEPGFVNRYSTPASFSVWRSSIPPVPVIVLRMVSLAVCVFLAPAAVVYARPHMLLILKLTLVPSLVLGATLAVRRWGPRIGGLLTGLPIVSGPALFFFAVEQGNAFAAVAS